MTVEDSVTVGSFRISFTRSRVGLKGGFSFIQGCSKISLTPILSSALVFNNFLTKSLAAKEKFLGKPILQALILPNSSFWFFDLKGASMASDAFFPFPDCVEIAHKEGINAVIQPGGSIKDQLSIDFCNQNKVAMVFTGIRHFKH